MSAKGPQRVVWSEGLLMAPQHLQQLDIYHERLLAHRVDAVSALSWGVHGVEFDQRALSTGQLVLTRFRGVLPDGAVLDLDAGDGEMPPMRTVAEHFPHSQRALDVYLTLAQEREGINNFGLDSDRSVRYRIARRAVRDITAPQHSTELPFGQRNFVLMFGDETLEDYVGIKVAEIVRDDTGGYLIAEPYIPPCVRVDASPFLMGALRRLLQYMMTRYQTLAESRRQSSAATIEFTATDVTRFLLLNTIGGFVPPLQHMADAGDLPPRTVYLVLTQLAGQLCTFSPDADPARLPKFVYTDLRSTFEELFARIIALLHATAGEDYLAIPLDGQDDGMHLSKLEDDRLIQCDRFLLSVKTDLPEKQVASQLPHLAKVASWEDIHSILSAATPGSPVEVSYRPPPEIPIKSGLVYFTVSIDNSFWRKIILERCIAVYLPPFFDPACTKVELLAIPRRGPTASKDPLRA
jgi:type VI secretion system protein ImpJ